MIPPFAPLFKHMDGIAFQAMRPRPAGSIIQSTVSTQVTEQIRQFVKSSLDTASPSWFPTMNPLLSTAIPMVGGQIQLLVISQYDAACLAQNSNSPRTQ